MTIITKPLSDKKPNQQAEPLVDGEKRVKPTAPPFDVEHGDEKVYVMLPSRRFSFFPTACLFVTALLVMSIGVISGVYLYQKFARSQTHKYTGWCNIPYDGSNAKLIAQQRLYDETKEVMDESNRIAEFFKEKFELDLEQESYEKIDVPDFRGGLPGRFIHDFISNKTGIIDLEGSRCFIMPLNRNKVVPPKNMFDIIKKMSDGYYDVDTEVVRETMRVITPPITDFSKIGVYIERECSNFDTYMLEKTDDERYKRSVSDTFNIREFAGNNIMEFNIILDELNNHEKSKI